MENMLQLLPTSLLPNYTSQVAEMHLRHGLGQLQNKEAFATTNFDFYVQSSATYSSNIEGNSIDIDTYLKNKRFSIKAKPKEMAEIDDLIEAYNYAKAHPLNLQTFLESHKLLSRHLLSLKSQRGKLRNQQVGIFSQGNIEYMAAEAHEVGPEMDKLFGDIHLLIAKELTLTEVFYYASAIHLMFEKIHPFMDGNGRAGRLLEKWFLASKLQSVAWAITSEQYYAKHRPDYYRHIHIGFDYYNLQLDTILPFLLMLPKSLIAIETPQPG
jgi:Fic family protein